MGSVPARRPAPVTRPPLIEQIASLENLRCACIRERKNGGAPGIDGMTVEELPGYLERNGPRLREQLLDGSYQPQPVRKVNIPKPGSEERRMLAIPTVVDRLVHQAAQRVMAPIFDPVFSASSFAFRPNRNAHQAVERARRFVEEGFNWMVHVDLKDFFDSIPHDLLLDRLGRRVRDERTLRLVRKFISAPFLDCGVAEARPAGVPQGAPLSPLLANVFLDPLDKELESQGHMFCRYADDISLYVDSRETAEAVFDWFGSYLKRALRMEINPVKSGIGRPWELPFLSYLIREKGAGLQAAPAGWKQLKQKVTEVIGQNRHLPLEELVHDHLNPVLRGWRQYFRLGITEQENSAFRGWLLDHLRCGLWQNWQNPKRRARQLMVRGIPAPLAWEAAETGYHNRSGQVSLSMEDAFPDAFFSEQGLVDPGDAKQAEKDRGRAVPPPVIYGRFFE